MDGYAFDPGSFREVRQAWNDILAGLEQDRVAARSLTMVLAPGHEPASGFVARTQNDSGNALVNAITSMQAFAKSYLQQLEQSGQEYQAQETTASQTFPQQDAMT